MWDVLSDLTSWSRHAETVEDLELLTAPPIGEGTRIRLKQTSTPEGNWDITTWEPPTYFELRQKKRTVNTVVGHRVEPLGDQRARLTLTLDMTGILIPIIALFARGMTTRLLAREADDLKRAAENSEL